MSVIANATYTASFPMRPDIMGAPGLFKFGLIDWGHQSQYYIRHWDYQSRISVYPIPLSPPDPFQSGWQTNCLHWKLVQKMGEFSLIKINVTSICLFPYIKNKVTMDNSLNHGDDLPSELLSETNWKFF